MIRDALLIASISISLIVIVSANAETQRVDVPFPGPYMLDCTYSVDEFLIFNCLWRSDRIPESVQEELKAIENRTVILAPEEVQASKDKIIIDWLTAPDPATIPEPEPPRPTVADILKLKLDPGVLDAVNKLGECERGYDGWEAFQEKSVYEIPDQFIWVHGQIRNDVIVKDLNLKFEECRIQRDYPLSAMYKNMIDADLLGLDLYGRPPTVLFNQTTNFTKSELYKPLDAMDLFKAEQKASDWLRDEAPFNDPTLGCIPRSDEDVRCRNQGNPEPIIKDLNSYNQYINFRAGQIQTAQDYQDTIKQAKEAQCTVHYPIYKHRTGREGGAELPVWLEHCESIDDEFIRTGISCYKGLDRILCSDLRKIQEAEQ